MSDGASLAEILGWLGIVLVPATAIWGLLGAKPTRETETGRKLLTRGGYVTVALISCAAGLSAWSFYRNGVANAKEAAKQTIRDAQLETAAAQSREAAAKGEIAAANSAATFAAQMASQARADAQSSAQMAQSLAAAAEARAGEQRLASRVNAESARNLGRTSEALTQLERLLQPLEPISVLATWEIDPASPQMLAATRRLRAAMAAEEAKIGRPLVMGRFSRGFGPWQGLTEAELPLDSLLENFSANISFFVDPGKGARAASLRGGRSPSDSKPDLLLQIGSEIHGIDVVPATGAVRFNTLTLIDPENAYQSGKIVSWPDLESASAFVDVNRYFGDYPLYAEVRFIDLLMIGQTKKRETRRYHVSGDQARIVSRSNYKLVQQLPALEPLRERQR